MHGRGARATFAGLAMLIAMLIPALAHADESITILPGDFKLSGPNARQSVIVERVHDGQFTGQIGTDLSLTSSDPSVLKIEASTAIPV
ncbi:MAG: hypothetical protein JWM97_296, partial [Phycisphaerales bacterium]|nr:hypothetical protein [Phycisphaerales bacterium]